MINIFGNFDSFCRTTIEVGQFPPRHLLIDLFYDVIIDLGLFFRKIGGREKIEVDKGETERKGKHIPHKGEG